MTTGASTALVVGLQGAELKVRLCSPPVDGRANEELVRVVANAVRVKSREVELIAGHSGRSKQLLVALSAPELSRRIDELLAS